MRFSSVCRSRGVLIMVLLLCNSATKTAGWKSSYAFPDSYKFDHNETVEMEISELVCASETALCQFLGTW